MFQLTLQLILMLILFVIFYKYFDPCEKSNFEFLKYIHFQIKDIVIKIQNLIFYRKETVIYRLVLTVFSIY